MEYEYSTMEKIINIIEKKLQYTTDYKCKENYDSNNDFRGANNNDYLIYTLNETVVNGVLTMFSKIYVYYNEDYLNDLVKVIKLRYEARKDTGKFEVYLHRLEQFARKYSYVKFNGGLSYPLDTELEDIHKPSRDNSNHKDIKLNIKELEEVARIVEKLRNDPELNLPPAVTDI